MKPTFIGIIPARYASTRFPGKPLALLDGLPMIQHVYSRAARVLDRVVVATDDRRIFQAVEAFGGKAVMTSDRHRSGTDRCREAYMLEGSGADVVVNIQGDEPFVEPRQIEALCACFDDPSVDIATLARPVASDTPYETLADPNTPKLVVSDTMDALYFSRSVIPYVRGKEPSEWAAVTQFYTHVGMYGYRADVLRRITELPQSPLELAESLEQLRWLQAGYRIRVATTDCRTIGIDTPADLEAARELLKQSRL